MIHNFATLVVLTCLVTASDFGVVRMQSLIPVRQKNQDRKPQEQLPLHKGKVAIAILPDPTWKGIQKLKPGDVVTVLVAFPDKSGEKVQFHRFLEQCRIVYIAGKPDLGQERPWTEGTIVLAMKYDQSLRLRDWKKKAKIILIRPDANPN